MKDASDSESLTEPAPDVPPPAVQSPPPLWLHLVTAVGAAVATELVVSLALLALFPPGEALGFLGAGYLGSATLVLVGLGVGIGVAVGLILGVAEALVARGRIRTALAAGVLLVPAGIATAAYSAAFFGELQGPENVVAAMSWGARVAIHVLTTPATILGAGLGAAWLLFSLGPLIFARAQGAELRQQSAAMAIGIAGVTAISIAPALALGREPHGFAPLDPRILIVFAFVRAPVLPSALALLEALADRVLRAPTNARRSTEEPADATPLLRAASIVLGCGGAVIAALALDHLGFAARAIDRAFDGFPTEPLALLSFLGTAALVIAVFAVLSAIRLGARAAIDARRWRLTLVATALIVALAPALSAPASLEVAAGIAVAAVLSARVDPAALVVALVGAHLIASAAGWSPPTSTAFVAMLPPPPPFLSVTGVRTGCFVLGTALVVAAGVERLFAVGRGRPAS